MNDYSPEHAKFLKKLKKRNTLKLVLQIAIFIFIFLFWELASQAGWINSFIFSSPSRSAKMTVSLAQNGLFMHIGITLAETLAGFFLGTVIGTTLAIILWLSPLTRDVLDPYLVVLNSLPKIALGPIIIVWVGAGIGAIITVTLLISVIVTTIGVLNGFLETEEEKQLLLKTFGASKRQMFTRVVFPSSIPTIISVLKLNIGMSWVGVIVGEFLISKAGLGYLIVYGGQIFKMDIVMASTLILCALSAGMYFFVAYIERRVMKARLK